MKAVFVRMKTNPPANLFTFGKHRPRSWGFNNITSLTIKGKNAEIWLPPKLLLYKYVLDLVI